MKNPSFPIFLLLSLLFLAEVSDAAIDCGTVITKAAACVMFATGKVPKPVPACCTGLKQLTQAVKSVDDKKSICRCMKARAKSVGLQDRFLSQIPGLCKIKVGFPVSANINCETIR